MPENSGQLIAATLTLALAVVALVVKQLRNGKSHASTRSRAEPLSGEMSPDFWRLEFRQAVREELIPVIKDLEALRRSNHDLINTLGPVRGTVDLLLKQLDRR